MDTSNKEEKTHTSAGNPESVSELPEQKAEKAEKGGAVADGPAESVDLSDPNAFELLLDEDNSDDTRFQNAQKRLISLDISNQLGVTRVGDYIVLPGRVSLIFITLTMILFSVIGMSSGFIHFSATASNYLFPFAVLQTILFAQIALYHSSYRAQRTALGVIVTLCTILFMVFIDWAFIDLIKYPKDPKLPHGMLIVATVSFSAIPALMLAHLSFLGRGTRTVGIRRRESSEEESPEEDKNRSSDQESGTAGDASAATPGV